MFIEEMLSTKEMANAKASMAYLTSSLAWHFRAASTTPFSSDTLVQSLFQFDSEPVQFQVMLGVQNVQDAISLAEYYNANAEYAQAAVVYEVSVFLVLSCCAVKKFTLHFNRL